MAKKSIDNHNSIKEKIITLNGSNYLVIDYPDFIESDKKRIRVKGLGDKFAAINSFFFEYLKEYHIPVAFLKNESSSLKFYNHSRFPFYIKIFNASDKRTAKRFSIKEFELLNLPLFEFHYGNGKDSFISESHLVSFNLCTYEELKLINRICSKVNAVLKSYFERRGEILAEMNCYFGKSDDKIYLVDEFTPRSLKIIPQEINKKFINPYGISTTAQLKKYTDHLFTLAST